MIKKKNLVLASQSPQRIQLLKQLGIEPTFIIPPDIDETPLRKETPRSLAKRLALLKAKKVYEELLEQNTLFCGFILAADTVVCVGRRILPKPKNSQEATSCLTLLSGRSHRVYSAVCLINLEGKIRIRLVETRIHFKSLSDKEKKLYIASQEWQGKAGGYAIQGYAGCFIRSIIGSYTNVIGLPLYETSCLLAGDGFHPFFELEQHD